MNLNWLFAIKYTLAILLAWYLSSYFGFDKPYWSMMTVAIIGYPDPSLSLAKMAARLSGSVIGVIAVTLIANISINDHWLFTALIIIWLSICLFMTLISRYMMPYLFSLSGYTSAIIAFGTSAFPMPMTIFNLSQERLIEVIIGIIVYTFISYLFPNHTNIPQTKLIEKKIKIEKKQLLSNLFKHQHDKAEKNLKDILENSISYDETSQYESHFLSFKTARHKVKHLPLLIIFSIISMADKQFLTYASYKQFLDLKKRDNHLSDSTFYYFFDWKDAILNTLRLVISLVISVLFWLNTAWEYGYILPVLVSISFTFGITIPNANKLAFIILIVAFLVILISYILKFYFLIQATSYTQAVMIIAPIFLILGVLKPVGKLAFIISHIACISLIFMINFTNPMSFDFSYFANTSIALIFSIIIVILMLYIIPLSSAQQVESRKIHFILQKISCIAPNNLSSDKLKNTILLNINAISNPVNINKLYILLSLISLYQLAESKDTKNKIFQIIHSISLNDDKTKVLSLINFNDNSIDDISLKYSYKIISFLL
ncbi:FUSC family protein [Providencia rettgeri]|uniref:FUSC family protein n=1 Tax=Providencia rettgeri TaxID=587 RepID=UPI0034E06FD8